MKKFLAIVVLGLLWSGHAYAETIKISCVDEKRSEEENRDVRITINIDEAGNWINFGSKNYNNGSKSIDGVVVKNTEIEINRNEIRFLHKDPAAKIYMLMMIDRLDGVMTQTVKMGNKEFNYEYKCEKDVRKF